MSNPLLYQKIILPIDDSAAAPSIQMGGGVLTSSGTGIRGNGTSVIISVAGSDVATINSSGITAALPGIRAFTSTASVGGGATEALVVTGLLATDTILSVSQSVPGANSLPLLGFNTLANNALTVVYSADPGAGAIIVVAIKR